MMQSSHSNASQTSTSISANNMSPDEKVLQDLSTLSEQITLCQSMLVNAGPTSSIDANEALLTVIGFLEACVPRMVELIEAAAQGALKEETFEKCLVVNDKLTNVLADVEKDPKDRTPLTPAAAASSGAAAGGGSSTDVEDGMKKLSVVGESSSNTVVVPGGKTTGLESSDDPFAGGPDLMAPTPAAASADPFTIGDSFGSEKSAGSAAATKPSASATDNDDDFDAFFRDRTSAP
mmetsp:Transcript_38823/g.81614  ORF Transcript_38823/g.81614 Transcript_38823/m.81614 type:complete len:235 (+) Transcript_38823:110-814(+)